MNTPASEQEWPTPKMLNDAQYAIGQLSLKYDIGHTPHREIARVVFETLRPPAGVDDRQIALIEQDLHRDTAGWDTWQNEAKLFRRHCATLLRVLRSCHTAVTAAGVDTVGHTDVTVDELADILEEETWADVAAKLILSKYNVTRKVL